MRLFLFSLLLTSHMTVKASECRTADVIAGTLGCTSYVIDTPLYLTPPASTIVISVSGDVTINANILLDGEDGVTSVGGMGTGGPGGPGASEGGDFNGFGNPGGNGIDISLANGQVGSPGVAQCGGGGGGGVLHDPGSNGLPCNGAAGGTQGQSARSLGDFNFGAQFRGGFGGASGEGAPGQNVGTGGGGGGAITIESTNGNIYIRHGVKISARGGNGGNSPSNNLGGGGGGGSGGAVWLIAAGVINNAGTIDVTGGSGGRNYLGALSGGNGGNGLYRLEDSTGPAREGSEILRGFSSPDLKLKSDISCGTIAAKKENHSHLLFQMMMAFALIWAISKIFSYTQRNS